MNYVFSTSSVCLFPSLLHNFSIVLTTVKPYFSTVPTTLKPYFVPKTACMQIEGGYY